MSSSIAILILQNMFKFHNIDSKKSLKFVQLI